MFYCYILYSQKLNHFYVGSTHLLLETRLEHHLTQHYGKNKYTAKSDVWKLFFSIPCESLKQARQIEKHIRKMKSSKYIKNLPKYPEISKKLKEHYTE